MVEQVRWMTGVAVACESAIGFQNRPILLLDEALS
jgi:hypothetical protein